jgi:ABC-2 type transport system ATP-binding protein
VLLQVTKLMKIYKGSITALHDVSCSWEKGIVGVIGPNAAGKTTFLRILAGVEEATAGQICLDGVTLVQNKQLLRFIMGYLPQEFGFHKNCTGEVMLDYIAVLKGIRDKRMRQYMVDEAMNLVNLRETRKVTIEEYSFGMKRRLGIAQALLGKPRLLILDEPMEGLDPEERLRLGRIIATVADQSLVLIATHYMSNIELSCRKLLVLRQGYMLYEGTPAAMAHMADGLVWQVAADFQQLEELKKNFKVVGIQQQGEHVIVRIVSSRKPPGYAIVAKARLEEGYLVLMDAGLPT